MPTIDAKLRFIRRLRRKTATARRRWIAARDASPTGVARIHGPVLAGDLSPRFFALIGAQEATADVVAELERIP